MAVFIDNTMQSHNTIDMNDDFELNVMRNCTYSGRIRLKTNV